MAKEVLFLAHRLPYPPDKGDKIRSYHLLRYLAKKYDVHLGCFIDSERDEQYRSALDSLCISSKICRLKPFLAAVRSTEGFLTGQPMSWPYYRSKELQDWVNATLESNPVESVVCYSSPMSQYVMSSGFSGRRIMDFVDVDSDKWLQYSRNKRWPMRYVYAREARRLLKLERKVAMNFDASVFVTPSEAKLFGDLVPESRHKHYSVSNGVAHDYFDPSLDFSSPFERGVKALVFTGMMNYWANVDAVTWFSEHVFPRIRKAVEDAEFWIVGASPTKEVLDLSSGEGITVTGRVPDVRPYLRHAATVVAPLRIARGLQNKVLEALSMGCSVVCSSPAASGLEATAETPWFVADTDREFAEAVIGAGIGLAEAPRNHSARRYVIEHYDWNTNLREFEKIHTGDIQ